MEPERLRLPSPLKGEGTTELLLVPLFLGSKAVLVATLARLEAGSPFPTTRDLGTVAFGADLTGHAFQSST